MRAAAHPLLPRRARGSLVRLDVLSGQAVPTSSRVERWSARPSCSLLLPASRLVRLPDFRSDGRPAGKPLLVSTPDPAASCRPRVLLFLRSRRRRHLTFHLALKVMVEGLEPARQQEDVLPALLGEHRRDLAPGPVVEVVDHDDVLRAVLVVEQLGRDLVMFEVVRWEVPRARDPRRREFVPLAHVEHDKRRLVVRAVKSGRIVVRVGHGHPRARRRLLTKPAQPRGLRRQWRRGGGSISRRRDRHAGHAVRHILGGVPEVEDGLARVGEVLVDELGHGGRRDAFELPTERWLGDARGGCRHEMGIKRENASEHERDVRVVGGTRGHGRSTRKRAERRSEREKGRKGEREKGRKDERTKG